MAESAAARQPIGLSDLPLDALYIIIDNIAEEYWEVASQMRGLASAPCRDGKCQDNPGYRLEAPDSDGVEDIEAVHAHSADPIHDRNIKIANRHFIDRHIASEACPRMWNSWVINLSSVNRALRQGVFGRVMETFYLQRLNLILVEKAKDIFGEQRLKEIESVYIGWILEDNFIAETHDYFTNCFPNLRHVRKHWEQGPQRVGQDFYCQRMAGLPEACKVWTWMTIPGLSLDSLDIRISRGLLRDLQVWRNDPKPKKVPKERMFVRKLVIRENVTNYRPWMLEHRTILATVLANYRDVQELVLDFEVPGSLVPFLPANIFQQITPGRLPQCTQITFRFMPRSMGWHATQDFLDVLIRGVSRRFRNIERIKVVLRTADLEHQPAAPLLRDDLLPSRERLEAFAQEEALELEHLQSFECMYVDRLHPMEEIPVIHFKVTFSRKDENGSPAPPQMRIERVFWDSARLQGIIIHDVQVDRDLLPEDLLPEDPSSTDESYSPSDASTD